MNEDAALVWLEAQHAERMPVLRALVEHTLAENGRQNLIAAASEARVWSRHIVDSAQLLTLVPDGGVWLDIGTGGGFPGLVIAALRDDPVVLVEPRARRATYLRDTAEALGLGHVTVHGCRIERVPPVGAAVISARALAALPAVFALSVPHATRSTRWVLPKGRSAQSEVASARAAWHGAFHVKPSITDPEAWIVLADGVRPR